MGLFSSTSSWAAAVGIALCFVPLNGVLGHGATCLKDDVQVGEKCIFLEDSQAGGYFALSVLQCASQCRKRGMMGHLLVPENAEEDKAAASLCAKGGYPICFMGVAEIDIDDETGAWKFADDGEWAALTDVGTVNEAKYQNWCEGQPDNLVADQKLAGVCGVPSQWCKEDNGCWHDINSYRNTGAICGCAHDDHDDDDDGPASAHGHRPSAQPQHSSDNGGTSVVTVLAFIVMSPLAVIGAGVVARRLRSRGTGTPATQLGTLNDYTPPMLGSSESPASAPTTIIEV